MLRISVSHKLYSVACTSYIYITFLWQPLPASSRGYKKRGRFTAGPCRTATEAMYFVSVRPSRRDYRHACKSFESMMMRRVILDPEPSVFPLPTETALLYSSITNAGHRRQKMKTVPIDILNICSYRRNYATSTPTDSQFVRG